MFCFSGKRIEAAAEVIYVDSGYAESGLFYEHSRKQLANKGLLHSRKN